MQGMTDLKFDEKGLATAIVTDSGTGELLMVAHMNAEAYAKTLETREAHFWSRSRQELWHKGATSGNTMKVVAVLVDCDKDAVWLKVVPAGPACHTGARSCFFTQVG